MAIDQDNLQYAQNFLFAMQTGEVARRLL